MPRKARIRSISGIYHVTIRGINKQDIFEGEQDYAKFLRIIEKCQALDQFEVYAYCLMSNHVHILIRTDERAIGSIMKRIGTTYAGWFNWKYKRTGSLLQDRFYSEPVEDIAYLKTVWRYILQNPTYAGLEHFPGEMYRWSSIYAYQGKTDGITNTELLEKCFCDSETLFQFVNSLKNDDKSKREVNQGKRLSDEAALYLLREITECESITEFQSFPKDVKKEYIYVLRKKYKIPISQITRITGITYRTVKEWEKNKERPKTM